MGTLVLCDEDVIAVRIPIARHHVGFHQADTYLGHAEVTDAYWSDTRLLVRAALGDDSRGQVREGFVADLVVFDPETVSETNSLC